MKSPLALLKVVRRAKAAFFLVMALCFTLSGCWGKRELEERSLIELIGIDDGDIDRLKVTITVAIPKAHSPESGGPQGAASFTLSGEGRDVLDAFVKLSAFGSRELTGSHTTMLILGEEFAKRDVSPIIDAFSRGIEVRPNTLVAVCRGKANDFLRNLRSPEELTTADYLSKLVTYAYLTTGACPLVTAVDFVNRYQIIEASPWAPYLDLAAPQGEDTDDKGQTGASPKNDSQNEGPKPGVVLGTAVFALQQGQCKMVDYLDPEETRFALLMAGKAQNWFVTFDHPGDLHATTLRVHHVNVRTKVKRHNDSVEAHFKVRLTCTLDEYVVNTQAQLPADKLREVAAETMQKQIVATAQSILKRLGEMESDVIGLGLSVHGTFLTYPEFAEFGWPSRLRTVKPTFDVRVQVFSTGLTFQRAFPQ
ncbi:MAG: Ger(x)C family spore germination protein [Bacillota bacterium]|jgi:spore germination protein KC